MRTVHRRSRILLAVVIAVVAGSWFSSSVSAHTDFESSDPADGAVVTSPVDEIVITFTSAATEAGDGFQVLDAAGQIRTPSDVTVEDDRIFRLRFDPPLDDGVVGVRWSVRAGDAHPIAGSFSFTVDAPAPTAAPTTLPAEADQPVASEAATTLDVAGADTEASESGTTSSDDDGATAAVPGPSPTAPSSTVPASAGDTVGGDAVADPETATPTALADFLEVADEPDGAGVARVGRIISFAGVVFGLGVLAFATAVFVGERREVLAVLRAAQALAGLIAIGAVIEYVGVSRLLDERLAEGWSTSAGFATLLRLLGGVAIVVGLALAGGVRVERRRVSPVALSAGVISADPAQSAPTGAELRAQWRPDRRSLPVAVGVLAVVVSFWFDGHTVTKGFRPLHALVNSIHVVAAAIWVGGVAALAVVAWARHRADRPARFGELVVRFSSIATVALVAVALAGSVMTAMILDSFDELTGTPWGEIMLLKLAAVAVAVAFGAYNHFRLRPALEAAPDDPGLLVVVRNMLTAEAIVLTFVVVVTAWLVAAAS